MVSSILAEISAFFLLISLFVSEFSVSLQRHSFVNGAPKVRKFGEIAKEGIKFNIINK